MKRFVWFRSLGRLGEEAINLYSCRRFIVSRIGFEDGSRTEIFYLTQNNRWIRYRKDQGYDPENGTPCIFKHLEECFPEQVAHTLLQETVFEDELPEELNNYRQYGDFDYYNKWRYANRNKLYGHYKDTKYILPQYDGKCIMYGGKLCKIFSKTARNQQKVLDEFQKLNWPETIKNPFKNEPQLKQTIRDMNEWEDSSISFGQKGKGVYWRPKAPERISPKTS